MNFFFQPPQNVVIFIQYFSIGRFCQNAKWFCPSKFFHIPIFTINVLPSYNWKSIHHQPLSPALLLRRRFELRLQENTFLGFERRISMFHYFFERHKFPPHLSRFFYNANTYFFCLMYVYSGTFSTKLIGVGTAREAKRHPFGTLSNDGTVPSIICGFCERSPSN